MAADVLEATSHGYDGYVFDREGKKCEFIGYRADSINNYAIHYLHQYDGKKPFFSVLFLKSSLTIRTITAGLRRRMARERSLPAMSCRLTFLWIRGTGRNITRTI